MRKQLRGAAIGFAAALTFLAIARAQTDHSAATKTTPQSGAYDPHDLTGIWDPAPYMHPKGEVNPLDLSGHPNPLPPFTPAGQARYEANAKFIAAGAVLDCDPFGVARNFFTPRPFEILLTRDRLVQHFEYYDNWREIFTDGRKMPDDFDPEYMGYSTGRWEGDTFVVESSAYNGKAFLTWQGFPISQSLHQTERWQRIDADTLKIAFIFDDPVNYSKPWSMTGFWKLKRDWVMDAHPCTLSAIKEYDEKVNHADKLPGRDYGSPDKK